MLHEGKLYVTCTPLTTRQRNNNNLIIGYNIELSRVVANPFKITNKSRK